MDNIFEVTSIEELNEFIEQGGNIYELCSEEQNALFFENAQKDVELFRALIDKGLNYKLRNEHEENIIYHIHYPHIVPVLAQLINFNDSHPLPEYLPVENYVNSPEIMKELIHYGLGLENKDKLFNQTVVFASDITDETALLLIENNIKVCDKNIDGRTMLFETESLLLTKYAIKKGLSVEEIDDYGNTAIMGNENDDIVKYLIQDGADISHKNFENQNILFTRENDLNMLKFLVKSGVDINVISNDGKNALSNCSELEEAMFLINSGIEIIDSKSYKNEDVKNYILGLSISQEEKEILSTKLVEVKMSHKNARI